MEKALVNIIFGHEIFVCEPIFKNFTSLYRTFGMKKDDKVLPVFVSGHLRTWCGFHMMV